MKKKLMCVLSVLVVSAYAGNDESSVQMGVGISSGTSPYKGISSVTLPLPDIELNYKSAFIEGINAGYNVYDSENLQLSVMALPVLLGYQSKDSDALRGMDNRHMSIEGALRMKYTFEKSFFTTTLARDVGDVSNGYSFNVAYNYTLFETFNQGLSLYAGAEYLSDKKSTYYYGVKAKEATPSRARYDAEGALNPFIGLSEVFALSKTWSIIANVEYKRLDSTIYKSPIVDDRYMLAGYLAIMYRF